MLDQHDFLAIIISIKGNDDNLRRLTVQLKSPLGVIPFVGAGLSIPFGFPAWGSFLLDQAKQAGVEKKIRQMLNAGEYEQAAETLLFERAYQAFHDAIDSSFGSHKLADKNLKGAVSSLPQLAAGPVITTNFDHVLETVFRQSNTPFERIVWGAKADLVTMALNRQQRILLKLHGDADDITERVLTKTDYQKHYGSADGSTIDLSLPLPRLLHQVLVSRPLLFLGCSLQQDRTVTILARVSEQFRAMAHYAIVELPVSDKLYRQRARFLSDHNIRPLWYPNGRHDLIEPLLAYLTQTSMPNSPVVEVKTEPKTMPTFEIGICTEGSPWEMRCTSEIIGGLEAATRVVEEIEFDTKPTDNQRFDVRVTRIERIRSSMEGSDRENRHKLRKLLIHWEDALKTFEVCAELVLWNSVLRETSSMSTPERTAQAICGLSKHCFGGGHNLTTTWWMWYKNEAKTILHFDITEDIKEDMERNPPVLQSDDHNNRRKLSQFEAYTLGNFDNDDLYEYVLPTLLAFVAHEKYADAPQTIIDKHLDVSQWRWSINDPTKYEQWD